MLERDATPLPADPDAAFWWDRRGAPQVRHSHAFLARLRNLLRDRHPDVLAGAARRRRHRAALRRGHARHDRGPDARSPATRTSWRSPAGARPSSGCCARPRSPRPACRCSTAWSSTASPPPTIPPASAASPACTWPTAARSTATSSCWPAAAAATSRRWFEAIGAATVEEDDEDTGIVYWSRFYRLTGEAPVTDGPDRRRPRLPEVRGVPGRQRHVLRHPRHARTRTPRCGRSPSPERFDAAAAALQPIGPWLAPGRERGDHRGAPDGEAAQPHPALRRRRPPGRARRGRHRRRPHLHQPALRPRAAASAWCTPSCSPTPSPRTTPSTTPSTSPSRRRRRGRSSPGTRRR